MFIVKFVENDESHNKTWDWDKSEKVYFCQKDGPGSYQWLFPSIVKQRKTTRNLLQWLNDYFGCYMWLEYTEVLQGCKSDEFINIINKFILLN